LSGIGQTEARREQGDASQDRDDCHVECALDSPATDDASRLIGAASRQKGSVYARLRRWWPDAHLRGWVTTTLIVLAALTLFCLNNDFQLGLHFDELSKMAAIVQGQSYYRHPLFMTEMTRFAVWLLGVADLQGTVEVGRTLSAIAATVAVAALFRLILRRSGELTAIVVTFAAMTTPLLAVHAHYLKEDVWLLCFCALAMLCFRRLVDQTNPPRIVLFGLCIGFAISSKAIGAFLIPAVALAILLQAAPVRRRLLIPVTLAGAVAVAVVPLVNLRMLFDYQRAWTELSAEIYHGAAGGNWDRVAFPAGYHLTHSIWQGAGPVLLMLGILGLALSLLRWRQAEPTDRLMTVYALIYYGLIEGSPLTPWPDVGRYAVPLIVPIAYFAGCTIQSAGNWFASRELPKFVSPVTFTMTVLALVPTALVGVRLVAELKVDTRLIAEKMLTGKEAVLISERFGTPIGDQVRSLAMLDPQRIDPRIRYLLASSFLYDRFEIGASVGGARNAEAKQIWAQYQAIFALPYCEIRPRFMSYGFSNPIIRIIDLNAASASGVAGSRYDTSFGSSCATGPP
jgi:hypothetical protein